MNIKPIGDRVLILADKAEEKTSFGIYIPDNAKEKPLKGTVIAVGNGIDKPLTVKVDDRVLYGKYAGTEVNYDGIDYIIMRESDILAVL
jgi:chaperonin GroES